MLGRSISPSFSKRTNADAHPAYSRGDLGNGLGLQCRAFLSEKRQVCHANKIGARTSGSRFQLVGGVHTGLPDCRKTQDWFETFHSSKPEMAPAQFRDYTKSRRWSERAQTRASGRLWFGMLFKEIPHELGGIDAHGRLAGRLRPSGIGVSAGPSVTAVFDDER